MKESFNDEDVDENSQIRFQLNNSMSSGGGGSSGGVSATSGNGVATTTTTTAPTIGMTTQSSLRSSQSSFVSATAPDVSATSVVNDSTTAATTTTNEVESIKSWSATGPGDENITKSSNTSSSIAPGTNGVECSTSFNNNIGEQSRSSNRSSLGPLKDVSSYKVNIGYSPDSIFVNC